MSPKTKLSRLPSSPDIEKAALGLMIDSGECLQKGIAALDEFDFYEENIENNAIFRAIKLLHEQKLPVTIETILNKLNEMKEGASVNFTYIDECILIGSNPALFDSYLEILNHQKIYRAFLNAANEALIDNQRKDIKNLATYLLEQQNKFEEVFKHKKIGSFQDALEISRTAKEGIEYARQNANKQGLTTSFSKLDRITRGFQPSDLISLAARPGTGKTALAINIAADVCRRGSGVGFFSTEMSTKQIAYRFLSHLSRIPQHKIESGETKDPSIEANLPNAYKELESYELFIDDSTNVSITSLSSKATLLKNSHPNVKLIIIDYLGLIHSDNVNKNRTHQDEVSDIVKRLKELARELEVAILLICQLNRKAEERKGEPQLQDLRESGQIEAESDKVIFIHDPKPSEQRGQPARELVITVAKNRNGSQGMVNMRFEGATMTFMETISDDGFSNMIPK
ncbi:MAG: AAA family ATPase [Erysipelotrichaceae bacterium]|nr:AAA family ATPase [Erysipelotrichaceae bacterium]